MNRDKFGGRPDRRGLRGGSEKSIDRIEKWKSASPTGMITDLMKRADVTEELTRVFSMIGQNS